MMVEKELELISSNGTWTGTGIEREMSWELLNLLFTPTLTIQRLHVHISVQAQTLALALALTGMRHHRPSPFTSTRFLHRYLTSRHDEPHLGCRLVWREGWYQQHLLRYHQYHCRQQERERVGVGTTILTNPSSTFESANRTQNAFYEPPPISHQITSAMWG
jgi:hypothetical protein